MDLAIRVNVRYAAPPNSQIKDALRLFKSQRWVESIIRYIMPQLNSVSPASVSLVEQLTKNLVQPRHSTKPCTATSTTRVATSNGTRKTKDRATAKTRCHGHQEEDRDIASCVICMENLTSLCVELPCGHQYHLACIEPWLRMHSTCPTCRDQLPTDAFTNYSVYAINTTIILQQSQARMPTAELLELPASNQVIRAIVNARVRRNMPLDTTINNVTGANAVATTPALTSTATSDNNGMTTASTHAPQTAIGLDNALELPSIQANESTPVMNAAVLQRTTSDFGTNECNVTGVESLLPSTRATTNSQSSSTSTTRRRCRSDIDAPQVINKRARLEAHAARDENISTSV